MAPRVDDRAPVPAHVAWTGPGGRSGSTGGELVAEERRAIGSLVAAAEAIGVEWLTVQVAGGASSLAPAAARDLGPRAAVRVLGAPGGRSSGPARAAITVVLADGGLGRVEIVHAVAAMAADGVAPETVDEKVLAGYLYEPDVPDPDLVVVSGGERRVPDLLTWELAYSELVFIDARWPAVDGAHLVAAVDEYRHRNRRYGGIESTRRRGGGR